MAENDMNIPTELQFRDVRKQNKVIINKQQRQVLPQNGTSFTMTSTGQNQIIIRFPNDENSSIDFNSMWITCNLEVQNIPGANITQASIDALNKTCLLGATVADTGAITVAPTAICYTGDSAESLLSRVAVYCNGSELERLDMYSMWESASNAHQNNANFANSIGAGGMLMNMGVIEKSRLFLTGTTSAATFNSNKVQVSFPLRYLGLANCRSLIPTYLMGGGQSSIEIRLYLSTVLDFLSIGTVESIAAAAPTAPAVSTLQPICKWKPLTTVPNIVLSDVRVNVDYVQTSEDYSSALREYLTANALTIPINTYYHTTFGIKGSVGGWQNFTVSTQFSDIQSVFLAFFKSSELNNIAYAGNDRLQRPKLIQARLSINGAIYPNVPIVFNDKGPCSEAYQYLLKAFSQNASLEILGNTNQKWVSNNQVTLINGNSTITAAGLLRWGNADLGDMNGISTYPLQIGEGYYYGVDKRYNHAGASTSTYISADNATSTIIGIPGDPITGYRSIVAEQEWFWTSPTNFVLGFDVSKSSYNDEYTLSGADLSKTSGLIQVQLQIDAADANDYTCLVAVQHKRLLEIGMDNSTIVY